MGQVERWKALRRVDVRHRSTPVYKLRRFERALEQGAERLRQILRPEVIFGAIEGLVEGGEVDNWEAFQRALGPQDEEGQGVTLH